MAQFRPRFRDNAVGNDVDLEIGRGLLIDGFEKGQPLLMAMTRGQAGDQLAFKIIERAKQGQRANLARNRGSWCECGRSPAANPVASSGKSSCLRSNASVSAIGGTGVIVNAVAFWPL
jgi:hypothetical protein